MPPLCRELQSRMALIPFIFLLGACSVEDSVRVVTSPAAHVAADPQRLIALPRPPILAATEPETLPLARLNATRTRWRELYGRTDARAVTAEALPFLTRTPEGRRFLAATGARAIARGMPAEICPATVTVAPPGTPDMAELVEQTLASCLQRLQDHPDCGCRVLAIGGYLTVPREDLAYATGTTARMLVPGLGVDAVMVAEDEDEGTLVRDLRGPVARVVRRGPDGAEVTLLRDGRVFTGRREPIGYRRGRIAERIYARDATGTEMTLLIGFSPDELEQRAAAWLTWKADG